MHSLSMSSLKSTLCPSNSGPSTHTNFIFSSTVTLQAPHMPVASTMMEFRDTRVGTLYFLVTSHTALIILTGPNMAGKSTYIRQVALITLLAQIGCWVPAKRCRLGLVDRIFTRVGASDDLVRGQSTFMVEMNETANILNNATPKSLVILDEIGRGTSTFDGLALAWAVARHLVTASRAFTLFATHYFELTQLAQEFRQLANVHLDAKEHGADLVFLHAVEEGPASQSYGIQVARLAGVPSPVIHAARRHLRELEDAQLQPGPQGDLFAAHFPNDAPPPHPALDQLRELDPDTLTPKAALDMLYALKALTDTSP